MKTTELAEYIVALPCCTGSDENKVMSRIATPLEYVNLSASCLADPYCHSFQLWHTLASWFNHWRLYDQSAHRQTSLWIKHATKISLVPPAGVISSLNRQNDYCRHSNLLVPHAAVNSKQLIYDPAVAWLIASSSSAFAAWLNVFPRQRLIRYGDQNNININICSMETERDGKN